MRGKMLQAEMAENCKKAAPAVTGYSRKARFPQRMLQAAPSGSRERRHALWLPALRADLPFAVPVIAETTNERPLPTGVASDQALAVKLQRFVNRVVRALLQVL